MNHNDREFAEKGLMEYPERVQEMRQPHHNQTQIDRDSARILRVTSYGLSQDEKDLLDDAVRTGSMYENYGPELERILERVKVIVQ